jgi:ribose transport system permease protein
LPQGIIALGVGMVIISGGIDLSIGAVLGLSAVSFAVLLENHIPPVPAALIILCVAPFIGMIHGLLITKLRLQPFLVTLCGLFIYRGLAQCVTWTGKLSSRQVGIAATGYDVSMLDFLINATIFGVVPWGIVLLLLVSAFAAVVLHGTVYGRYLYAIGANEQAARYAGIEADRYKIMAYMWCSLMAGLGGLLTILDSGNASPANTGAWYELYAITAAVLGGCSLRGGEGTVAGILLGATIYPLVWKFCNFADLSSDLHPTILGAALLLGTIIDETLKRRSAARI